MSIAGSPGTLGREYGSSDSNPGTYDSSSHCCQQCSLQSVFDGEIRCCGSRFRCISYHGKTIGSGNLELAKVYSKKLQKLFVVMGLTCGILLFFIRIPVLSLYQLSPETREMANTFLIILSVVMVGMSYQMPTNGGIIRGSGSIAYSMKVDLISTWGIVIPLSMFMAFVVNASPAIVVCCLNADQIFKCVPAFLKCNYGHWIKNMTN